MAGLHDQMFALRVLCGKCFSPLPPAIKNRIHMRFDFDSETRRRLGYRLIDQIDSFFSSLPDRPVQLPVEQRITAQSTIRCLNLAKMPPRYWTMCFARWWTMAFMFPAPIILV